MQPQPNPFLSRLPNKAGCLGRVLTYRCWACGSRGWGLAAPQAGLGQTVHLEDRKSTWLQKPLTMQRQCLSLTLHLARPPNKGGVASITLGGGGFNPITGCFYLLNQKIQILCRVTHIVPK